MTENVISTSGEESQNAWFSCADIQGCGYIGVHPNGVRENCPDCRSGLEAFSGQLWKCGNCETEYVGRGDAEDCCQQLF